MIKNLIFDFGKVLVDYDYMRIINQMFDDDERRCDFYRKIITPDWINTLDTEERPFMENIHAMQAAVPEYAAELQQMGERYHEFVTGEVPGMRDLLMRLKARGFRLYGLSNWCSPVHKVMRNYDGIFSLLDGRIVSCEEQIIKPDIRIYQRLCERYGLKPEECVFADDKQANIDGAVAAGMRGILFKDACQYERELEEMVHW